LKPLIAGRGGRVGELFFALEQRGHGHASVRLRSTPPARELRRVGTPRVVTGTLFVHTSGDTRLRSQGKVRLKLTFARASR
jgi:hypothetical protein